MPVAGVPADMPLTVQVTLVSVAPVTVAVKLCALPKSTEAVAGATVTLTDAGDGIGGGGCGGWTTAENPPAHPVTHVTVARRSNTPNR